MTRIFTSEEKKWLFMGETEWQIRPGTPKELQNELKVKLNNYNHVDSEHNIELKMV